MQPVMVLGSFASSITLLWFGLSGSFTGAVSARVAAGLLNGIIVAWKCCIGESCTPLEQGRVSAGILICFIILFYYSTILFYFIIQLFYYLFFIICFYCFIFLICFWWVGGGVGVGWGCSGGEQVGGQVGKQVGGWVGGCFPNGECCVGESCTPLGQGRVSEGVCEGGEAVCGTATEKWGYWVGCEQERLFWWGLGCRWAVNFKLACDIHAHTSQVNGVMVVLRKKIVPTGLHPPVHLLLLLCQFPPSCCPH
jgi:hypothetical protein